MNLYYNTCMLHCFIVQLICVQVQSIHDMIIIENCPIIRMYHEECTLHGIYKFSIASLVISSSTF